MTFKSGITNCDIHGEDFIEHKCRYCCHVASWFCFGTTRFCDPCHDDAGSENIIECKGSKDCPLNGRHPPNGEEYAIGCRMCKNEYIEKEGI